MGYFSVFTFINNKLFRASAVSLLSQSRSINMGLEFGNMERNIRGVITYHLSPYEQRPFAGAIKNGFNNSVRRTKWASYWALPFIGTYVILDWAFKMNAQATRKNPKDFE